jgi:formylmethanofuran dehydrogenase subunit E
MSYRFNNPFGQGSIFNKLTYCSNIKNPFVINDIGKQTVAAVTTTSSSKDNTTADVSCARVKVKNKDKQKKKKRRKIIYETESSSESSSDQSDEEEEEEDADDSNIAIKKAVVDSKMLKYAKLGKKKKEYSIAKESAKRNKRRYDDIFS